MKRILSFAVPLALATLLTGCFDGSSSSSNDDRPDPAVDFTTFVKAQIDDTDDTREPVQINNQEFSFNDQNNEQAFDDLLTQ